MLAELKAEMCGAVTDTVSVDDSVVQVWGYSLSEIVKVVMDKAIELGREYRPQIEEAAREAVDALVSMDIPGVPAICEGAIDSATREAGYTAITAILDALLGLQAG